MLSSYVLLSLSPPLLHFSLWRYQWYPKIWMAHILSSSLSRSVSVSFIWSNRASGTGKQRKAYVVCLFTLFFPRPHTRRRGTLIHQASLSPSGPCGALKPHTHTHAHTRVHGPAYGTPVAAMNCVSYHAYDCRRYL